MTKVKSAAILTIKDAANMSDAGARRIALWLRRQAKHLTNRETRKALSPGFRARYLYRD